MTKKIIIDTDPGVDDALAIQLAVNSPELDVLGLTTVFGNVSVDTATNNALILGDIAGVDLPVYKGAATPLERAPGHFPEFVHGDDGFGNINWPPSSRSAEQQSAVDFIAEQVRKYPGEVTLVPLGPLTNIAHFIQQYPELIGDVKEVVLMGGAVFCTGNVSPVAEANIINDPHAGEIVFAADWPVVMLGLDVTTRIIMNKEIIERVAKVNPQQGEFLAKASDFYIEFYNKEMGINGCCVHDPATVIYVINPALFTNMQGAVRVVTEGLTRGQTTFAPVGRNFAETGWSDRPIHNICVEADAKGVLAMLEQRLSTPLN